MAGLKGFVAVGRDELDEEFGATPKWGVAPLVPEPPELDALLPIGCAPETGGTGCVDPAGPLPGGCPPAPLASGGFPYPLEPAECMPPLGVLPLLDACPLEPPPEGR